MRPVLPIALGALATAVTAFVAYLVGAVVGSVVAISSIRSGTYVAASAEPTFYLVVVSLVEAVLLFLCWAVVFPAIRRAAAPGTFVRAVALTVLAGYVLTPWSWSASTVPMTRAVLPQGPVTFVADLLLWAVLAALTALLTARFSRGPAAPAPTPYG